MANEVSLRVTYTLQNGSLYLPFDKAVNDDQATQLVQYGVQNVGFAAHEALNLGDVTTPGLCVLFNLDTTNYVEIGTDDTGAFVPCGTIRAGKPQVIEPAGGVTLYVKANTAAVKLLCLIPST